MLIIIVNSVSYTKICLSDPGYICKKFRNKNVDQVENFENLTVITKFENDKWLKIYKFKDKDHCSCYNKGFFNEDGGCCIDCKNNNNNGKESICIYDDNNKFSNDFKSLKEFQIEKNIKETDLNENKNIKEISFEKTDLYENINKNNIDKNIKEIFSNETSTDTKNITLSYCDECNIFKLPHINHCRECNCCVMEMDHHCYWFDTCVGRNNIKYFYIYIYSGIIVLNSAICGWNNIVDFYSIASNYVYRCVYYVLISGYVFLYPFYYLLCLFSIYYLYLAVTDIRSREFIKGQVRFKSPRIKNLIERIFKEKKEISFYTV